MTLPPAHSSAADQATKGKTSAYPATKARRLSRFLGVAQEIFAPIEDVKSMANLVYSETQGVQPLVRGFAGIGRFNEVASQLVRRLTSHP
ncbi:hypothetical protein [Nonomuraea rhizosphaerae]|uniref:hypothetical protein n=1 Tax=Nonomuraea rhizosphaerae TaxID=2665663 RepID=UPI001C5E6812|nr:hypothetical protein [Nonomuraea rhizosphaerae]